MERFHIVLYCLWCKWILLFIVSADFLSQLFSYVLCKFRLTSSSARVISCEGPTQSKLKQAPGAVLLLPLCTKPFFLRKSLSGLNKLIFVKNLKQYVAVLNNIITKQMSIFWKNSWFNFHISRKGSGFHFFIGNFFNTLPEVFVAFVSLDQWTELF